MSRRKITGNQQRARSRGFGVKKLLAGIATAALGFGMLVVTSTAATAAPEDALVVGVFKADGSPLAPGEVVEEGTALKLRIQYQKQDPPNDLTGTTHNINLGANVTIGAVPAGNTAVETAVANGLNGATITFMSPWPTGINQGIFDLDFVVNGVDESTITEFEWTINGASHSVPVTIRNSGDVFENITEEAAGKTRVSPGNLNGYVSRSGDVVTVNPNIIYSAGPPVTGAVINYQLTVSIPEGMEADDYDIFDQLPPGLSYVPGSFNYTLTTWDADGMNRQISAPAPFSPTISGTGSTTGQSFEYQTDLEGPTILTITYQATVADEASRVVLNTALQSEYDDLGGEPGNYFIDLTNEAEFGPNELEAEATIRMQGTVAGPCVVNCTGAAFSKNGDGALTGNWTTDEDGLIVDAAGDPAPVATTYTLNAHLSAWAAATPFTLDRNVVLADTLPAQMSWDTTDPNFLTLTANAGPITALTQTTCPAGADPDGTAPPALLNEANSAVAFNGDLNVGQYCVAGRRLLINIGQDSTTDISVAVKALLHTVEGLTVDGTSSIQGATRYVVPNNGRFYYRAGGPGTSTNNQYPVRLPSDTSGGLNDSSAFIKGGPDSTVSVDVGEVAVVPYTFTVNTAVTGVPAVDTKIVDRVDTSIFDLSDLAALEAAATSSYAGTDLGAGAIDLSLDPDTGYLVIELSAAAKTAVSSMAPNSVWVVNLPLSTFPFGKETFDITNHADLFGEGEEPLYWSTNETRATSFGTELEVRKHVYDRADSGWVQALVAPVDDDDLLIEDVYVYRVQLLAHGSFSGTIIPLSDILPAMTTFLGFVDEADVADGSPVIPGSSVSLGYGITATYTAGPPDTIDIAQAPGSFLPVGGEVAVYFAVQIPLDVPEMVRNSIGDAEAFIIRGGPSIDIEKWIDEGDDAPEYDENGRLLNDGYNGDYDAASGKTLTAGQPETIRFTISNDGPEPLIDIVVSDELVSGAGAITDLVCIFPDDGAEPGTEWAGPFLPGVQFECTGTLPALQPGQSHANTASVTGIGAVSGIPVDDEDDWHGIVPMSNTGLSIQAVAPWLFGGLALIALGTVLLWARRRSVLAD